MRLTLGVLAALACVLQAAAQVRPPAPASGGRISGRVVTSYAELVSDATVALSRADDPTGRPVATAKSGPGGGFSFDRVPAGRYALAASRRGYTSRQPVSSSDTPPRATFDLGPEIELSADAEMFDVEIVVYRPASIAGRIINPDGSAAPDVQVMVARSGRGRAPLLETKVWSQFDGRYEITGLPPGEYLVAAVADLKPVTPRPASTDQSFVAGVRAGLATGGTTADLRWTWYPGTMDAEEASPVTLFEGVSAEGIDVWLAPPQRFNVSGRVFWPVGTAVNDLVIDYGDPAGTRSGVWFLSDPGGLFTITGVPPGPLVLLARAETPDGRLIGMASTEVVVDSVEDVEIVVDRPGTIEGRVVYEDEVPHSAQATTIALVQKRLKVSALYPVPEADIGPDGRFQLQNALGEYEFELRGLPAGFGITRVARGDRTLASNRIGVTGGEEVTGIQVVVGGRD